MDYCYCLVFVFFFSFCRKKSCYVQILVAMEKFNYVKHWTLTIFNEQVETKSADS